MLKNILKKIRTLPPTEAINLLIIISPFLFYYWFIKTKLFSIEFPDAYAYLWRQPFNFSYLTGRSLFQRIVYTVCGNDPDIIASVQLLFFLATALILYFLLRNIPVKNKVLYNLFLSVFITFVFSSYTLNISAVGVSPEPIFLCLLLIFPAVLFQWPEKYRGTALLAGGIPLILSKNVAPYFVMLLLILYFLTNLKSKPKLKWFYLLLAALSISSHLIIHTFDHSVHINAANNIFKRVFPDPVKTRRFHEKYGMPVGPFVKKAAGRNVNIFLFDNRRIYDINEKTRSFELVPDKYGFTDWIEKKGMNAYLRFILLDDFKSTYVQFRKAFNRLFHGNAIRYNINFLLYVMQSGKDLLKKLSGGNPKRAVGFIGFDSLEWIRNILSKLGFGVVELVLVFIVIGFVLLMMLPFHSLLKLSVGMLASSLPLFFISYFGDAMELPRHVYPAFVLLIFAGVLFIFSLFHIAINVYKNSKFKFDKKNQIL